jgi:subtilisin family serine protease
LRNERGEYRAAPDPDDFSSGFGVWSGTSFSAPVFAGELAARLAERYAAGHRPSDNDEAVAVLQQIVASMPTGRESAGELS